MVDEIDQAQENEDRVRNVRRIPNRQCVRCGVNIPTAELRENPDAMSCLSCEGDR